VADVQPKLAARVRLLATGATNKNDPNDARSVAIAALRSPAVSKVRAENHAAVMRVWARRHRDLGSARIQVACRLHAVLCALVPGGFAGEISAARAARLLDELQPDGAVAAARYDLACQFAAVAAVTQIRHRHTDGRAYFERKLAEGKTGKEALRSLKRRISDALFARLQADARQAAGTLSAGPGGQPGNDSVASAVGSHPEHRLFGQATPGPDSTLRPRPDPRPGRQDHARREKPTEPLDNKEASFCVVSAIMPHKPRAAHSGGYLPAACRPRRHRR
jgi:hypothetical protein